MQNFIRIGITAISLQLAVAAGVDAETIKQRDYIYSYDEEARSLDGDVFVICNDCPDSRMNEIYTIAAHYSVNPEKDSLVREEPLTPQETSVQKPRVTSSPQRQLGPIRFKFNSYALSASSKEKLESYHLTDKQVRLEGYTCTIGTDRYNRLLSLNRSKAVANYLRSKGISVLETRGLGKSNKFSDKASNRRVEIIEGEKE